MKSKIIILEKKTCNKELELILIQLKKTCKLSEKIINNIFKSNDFESKPRVKYKSHTKGNIDQNMV